MSKASPLCLLHMFYLWLIKGILCRGIIVPLNDVHDPDYITVKLYALSF